MDDEELIEDLDDEELIEDLDDEELENPSPKQNIESRGSKVPSALQNRSLSKKGSSDKSNLKKNSQPINKKTPPNNNLSKGLKDKDSGIADKLKKKKKPLNFLKKSNNNSQDNSDSKSSNTSSGTSEDGSDSLLEVVAKAKRIILFIKVGGIVAGILAVLFIILVVVMAIASIFGLGDDFVNLGTSPNIDKSEPYYDEAKDYYEKLNKATEMYKDSCGIYLNRSYIHATLSYITAVSQDNDKEELYRKMANNVDEVAKLMVTNCVVDYEIGGNFYNNLKNSSFLKNYYSAVLKYMDAESLTKAIFEYAETGMELASLMFGYISDNLQVNMGTCEFPYTKNLLNNGTKYSSSVGFRSYIMGTIYAEVEDHITANKKEFLKAFTIVTTSYALGRSGYKSGDSEIWVHNGNCWQVSCDIVEGCHYTKKLPGGYGTGFTGPDTDGSYWKRPIPEGKRKLLEEALNEVLGTVMLGPNGGIIAADHYDKYSSCPKNEGNGCMGQDDAAEDAQNGMGYKEILEKYYDSYDLNIIKEDSYTGDVSYSNGGYTGSVVYYDQTDYNQSFCGLRRTIKTDGCGVASMAMILSTFVDKSFTPPVVMEEAHTGRYCGTGISGTSADFFRFSAQKHGLGYQAISKTGDMQVVLDALKSGNSLVIAHMGAGDFTNGGHYIVLTKVNQNGEVYVLDSNHSRKTGWHNFNDVVVKQLKSYGKFHIITKG